MRADSGINTERTSGLGLALGGGGMKGLAHVGAISVIESVGLRPDSVAGTSIGAVIGAMYAAGVSAADMKAAADRQPLLSLLSLRFDGKALIDVTGLRSFLAEYVGDVGFEDLPLKFVVTTTDLQTGELCLIDSGPVIDAVLASSAIPGLFAPVTIGDRLLMDGGMVENLPVDPLRTRGSRRVIGIRLFYQCHSWRLEVDRSRGREVAGRRKRRERISLEELRHLPASVIERWLQAGHGGIEAFRIAQRGLDLMVSRQESERLLACPPDVLISPDVVDIGPLDFHGDKTGVYEAGIAAAEMVSDALRDLERELRPAGSGTNEPEAAVNGSPEQQPGRRQTP